MLMSRLNLYPSLVLLGCLMLPVGCSRVEQSNPATQRSEGGTTRATGTPAPPKGNGSYSITVDVIVGPAEKDSKKNPK
jgi:hypothetical protein